MTQNSVWNPDNIRDIAESVGLSSLSTDVTDHLTRDVEFRIAQVLEEALKFMRHAKRTILFTQDVSQALRVLDVEPLYGYESARPLRFGEASIGPGQPLFYVEDEEMDFEKLINAPLPKVPREITFTAHWLAVEGVQPTIPQNPTPADSSRAAETLLPKSAGGGPAGSAALNSSGVNGDNLIVKPLVKHILSKELQLYFEHVSSALYDAQNDQYRAAALASLRSDPGLHQLVPYFVQFAAEKVTHGLKNLFVLTQTLQLVSALLENRNLHVAPYVASLVPPVLTCLVGKQLGPVVALSGVGSAALPAHYELRLLAASVLRALTRRDLATATPTLKPRLARTLLKHLLSAAPQPLGTYYGAVLGLNGIASAEGVRVLILPNLRALDEVLKEALADIDGSMDMLDEAGKGKRREVDAVVDAVVRGLETLEQESPEKDVNSEMEVEITDDERKRVIERVGEVVGEKVCAFGRRGLVKVILAPELEL